MVLAKLGIPILKPLVKRMCPVFVVGARLIVLSAPSSGHCLESMNRKFLSIGHAYQLWDFQEIKTVQMKYWIFESSYERV